jgi:predicted acetyltransferase
VHPNYRRRGIGKKLLEVSEDWMRDKGMRLSFLTTSPALVAYQWYVDVGYEIVDLVSDYPTMHKTFSAPAGKVSAAMKAEKRFDSKASLALFDWFNKDRCGFVIRNAQDLKRQQKQGIYERKLSCSVEGGYALLSNRQGCIRYAEMLARSKRAYSEMINLAESRARYGAVAIHPFDPKAQEVLAEKGYRCDYGNHDVLMVKRLGPDGFSDVYDDSFVISRIDWF